MAVCQWVSGLLGPYHGSYALAVLCPAQKWGSRLKALCNITARHDSVLAVAKCILVLCTKCVRPKRPLDALGKLSSEGSTPAQTWCRALAKLQVLYQSLCEHDDVDNEVKDNKKQLRQLLSQCRLCSSWPSVWQSPLSASSKN